MDTLDTCRPDRFMRRRPLVGGRPLSGPHDGQLLDVVVAQHGGRQTRRQARLVPAVAQQDRLRVS